MKILIISKSCYSKSDCLKAFDINKDQSTPMGSAISGLDVLMIDPLSQNVFITITITIIKVNNKINKI